MNKKNAILLGVGILLYVVLFLVFYPQYMTFSDENEYLRAAYQLSEGRIIIDDIFDSYRYYPINGNFIPKYPIANSVLLLPFTSMAWQLMFLLGLVLHVLGMYIFMKILDLYKVNRLYALLYLLYPGFVFYSRTIMSEIPTVLFTLLGFYLFLQDKRKSDFLAGLMFGFSALIRPTNALVIIAFALPSLYNGIFHWFTEKKFWNKHFKRLLWFVAGVIPPLIAALCYNYFIYGGLMSSSYSRGSSAVYAEVLAISNTALYLKPLVILLVMYPLMLLAPFVGKYKYKHEIIWTVLLFFVILGNANVIRYDWLTNLVIGHRYFFPIIPLILVPYSILFKKYAGKLLVVGIILLFLVTPAIMYKQDSYTDSNRDIMEKIYDNVPANSVMIGKDWPDIYFMNNYFDETLKVADWKIFKEYGYEGEFYFVHYKNLGLRRQVTKPSDLVLIEGHDTEFSEIVKEEGMVGVYNEDDLFIYKRPALVDRS